jgi:hypothetical protein
MTKIIKSILSKESPVTLALVIVLISVFIPVSIDTGTKIGIMKDQTTNMQTSLTKHLDAGIISDQNTAVALKTIAGDIKVLNEKIDEIKTITNSSAKSTRASFKKMSGDVNLSDTNCVVQKDNPYPKHNYTQDIKSITRD